MRVVELARKAAEAEVLHLRARMQRNTGRVVLLAIGSLFLIGTLVLGHVALWFCLRISLEWAPYTAAAALAGGDLAIALILFAFASRSTPSEAETAALVVRDEAWAGVKSGLITSVLSEGLRYFLMQRARRR